MLLEDTPISICTGEQPQGPSGSANLGFLILGSTLPGQTLLNLEGIHFFIKWSKTEQMGRCVESTKGRHMCPVPAMEAYRECCRCSSHSSPPT